MGFSISPLLGSQNIKQYKDLMDRQSGYIGPPLADLEAEEYLK